MRIKAMGRVAVLLGMSAGMLLVVGSRGGKVSAQVSPPTTGGQPPMLPSPQEINSPGHEEHDAVHEHMRQQAIVSANEARHKRMVADANKLLELSTQLKDDVDKTANDELSVEVIRKAAEIEKLAHDVHERMRQ